MINDPSPPDEPRNCINKITRRDHGFTMVDNRLARNRNLSARARGVMLLVLSHGQSWITSQQWLLQEFPELKEDAMRTVLNELEGAGYLQCGFERGREGRMIGYRMHWFEEPIEIHRNGENPVPVKPGSGQSPPSEYNVQKNTKQNKKKDALNSKKIEFPIGCEAAQLITLDLTAPEEIKRLWQVYQSYRTERHNASGAEKLAWTETAAQMAAEGVNRALLKFPEKMVADRIRSAIESRWKGLKMDKLGEDGFGNSPARGKADTVPHYGTAPAMKKVTATDRPDAGDFTSAKDALRTPPREAH